MSNLCQVQATAVACVASRPGSGTVGAKGAEGWCPAGTLCGSQGLGQGGESKAASETV